MGGIEFNSIDRCLSKSLWRSTNGQCIGDSRDERSDKEKINSDQRHTEDTT